VRRVHGVEGHVKKQRLIGGFFLNQANGFAGDEVRRVTFVTVYAVIPVPIKTTVAPVAKVVDVTVVVAVLVVEAAARRGGSGIEMTEVPFGRDGGGVAGGLEHLGQRAFLQRQAVLRAGADDADLQAVAHRVRPREQGRARRRTHGLNVKVLEFGAGGGEAIEVRGFDRGTVPADVGPAVVVGENENDIGARGGRRGRRRGETGPPRAQ